MSFFHNLNKTLDSIAAKPEAAQLNERDMSRAAKGYEKYGKEGMQALAKAGREGKSLDPVRNKYDKYDNKEVDEGLVDVVKKVGGMVKKAGSAVLNKVGHGSDVDMIRDLQRKMDMPQTGKKPSAAPKQTPIDPKDEYDYFTGRDKVRGGEQQQKTTEAARYRDPKYKDKLYTVEPLDYTYGPDADELYYNPKPDDYEGRKRKIGGGEFSHNDPLRKGFGRGGASNSINTHGKRKGMPSRDQITSLKGSIRDASGTHSKPNLPEMDSSDAASDAREAMAKQIYDLTMLINTNDKMYAQDSPQDTAKLQKLQAEFSRLYPGEDGFKVGSGFYNSEYERGQRQRQSQPAAPKPTGIMQKAKNAMSGMFKEDDVPMTAKQKSFAALAEPKDKITFADKIAGAKKEVDEMLGDVAAEAMRNALGGRQQVADEGNAFTGALAKTPKGGKFKVGGKEFTDTSGVDEDEDKNPFTNYKKPRTDTPRVGDVTHGAKHDTEWTATGRKVTRRVDAQGNSVGSETDAEGNTIDKRGRGRPKGPAKGPERTTANAYKHKGERKVKEGDMEEGADQGQAQQIYNDLADIRAIAKQAQRGGEFPQGYASRLESVLYAAMTMIKNQQSGDAQVREAESTAKKDNHAERAGKKVAKDIESDEKKKDGIHGKKRGAEDDKAEKAGKKVAKDIEHDDKKDDEKEDAPKKSKGKFKFGGSVYETLDAQLETLITEGMSVTVNMSQDSEHGEDRKNITVNADGEDADRLAELLQMAGMSQQSSSCSSCGSSPCGCNMVDENNPNWPSNTETNDNAMQYSGGLNGPKSTGQSTTPVLASQLRRQISMEQSAKVEKNLLNLYRTFGK